MFTGIIEEVGKVQAISKNSIKVVCSNVLENTNLGDSIAVSGVCLTVIELGKDYFTADVSSETYNLTVFSKLKSGDDVNLERAMQMNGRLGGHIVSGHVDGIGKILFLKQNNECFDLSIELSDEESKYVIKKGSITINGISLTVANIQDNVAKIAVIPTTYENTNLKSLKVADFVNIEVDILAKYVEKFLSTRDNRTGISVDFLQRNGFC